MPYTPDPAADTLPIACLLPADAQQARGEDLAHDLFTGIRQTQELEDGYAFMFPGDGDWLARLATFVAFERACCPFFTFELICLPQQGPIWLHLRGPEGVKEFIRQEFGAISLPVIGATGESGK